MIIKAITVYDPWASLIALGEKKIETRGWYTKYRGPIAIHAGKKYAGDISFQEPFFTALAPQHSRLGDAPGKVGISYHLGCILAICNLVDCINIDSIGKLDGMPVWAHLENGQMIEGNELAFGDYTPGRYAWILEDVRRLAEPIPVRGRQRIWNWEASEHLVWFDPYVVGSDQIWTPQGILTGQVAAEGTEDAVQGLQIIEVAA